MSRSYKHNPFSTVRASNAKYWKRLANHKVRRCKEIPKGNGYRKIYESWNICDWTYYESKYVAAAWYKEVTAEDYHNKYWVNKYPTFEDYINKSWKYNFYRK